MLNSFTHLSDHAGVIMKCCCRPVSSFSFSFTSPFSFFSSSAGPDWCSAGFCSGSSSSHTHATRRPPQTCGASLDVQSASSPSRPRNLAAGVCTSPLTPAGGAVRPGRWAGSVLHPQRGGEMWLKHEVPVSKADNFTQRKWTCCSHQLSPGEREKKKTDGQTVKYRDGQIGSETNSVDRESLFLLFSLHSEVRARSSASADRDSADRQIVCEQMEPDTVRMRKYGQKYTVC